jgi:hypothetical protein
VHAVLSDGYRSLGNVEQALLHAERQLELDPRGPDGYVRRIRLRRSLGDDRGIAADCDRLAALEIADLDEGLSRARELAATPWTCGW